MYKKRDEGMKERVEKMVEGREKEREVEVGR